MCSFDPWSCFSTDFLDDEFASFPLELSTQRTVFEGFCFFSWIILFGRRVFLCLFFFLCHLFLHGGYSDCFGSLSCQSFGFSLQQLSAVVRSRCVCAASRACLALLLQRRCCSLSALCDDSACAVESLVSRLASLDHDVAIAFHLRTLSL